MIENGWFECQGKRSKVRGFMMKLQHLSSPPPATPTHLRDPPPLDDRMHVESAAVDDSVVGGDDLSHGADPGLEVWC